jgi:branched-chain amino acid transport system substrate-binding protein
MKRVLLLLLCLGLLFVFSGCAGEPEAEDTTDVDDTVEVGEPIKIGFFAPLTGPVAADGESVLYAARIAVETINKEGGINGRDVELVYYDDHLDSSESVSIAQKLITSDEVVAVVSGSYSAPTRAAAEVYQRAGIPMIAAYAVHPDIPASGDYIFQQTFLGSTQGKAGAHIALEELGATKVAILYVDNDFGRTLTDSFKEYLVANGGEIVFEDSFSLGEAEFTPSLTRIGGTGAELLYFPAYPSEGGQIIRQALDINLDINMLATQGVDSSQFLDIVGTQADGLIITTNFNREDQRAVVQNFIADFTALAGYPPDMISVSTFDSFLILKEVMEQHGLNPGDIANGIRGLTNFEALSGNIERFTDLGEVVKPVQVQIIKNGAFTYFGELTDPEIIEP